jgi:hypothetical protein
MGFFIPYFTKLGENWFFEQQSDFRRRKHCEIIKLHRDGGRLLLVEKAI